jgi:PIN domain nuclease of toxin-antitoxin system
VIASILVDTHLVLWARIAPERLTTGERRTLDDARARYVSAVSLWQIAILIGLGRVARDERLLAVPDGFELLPLLPDHCRSLVALPQRHRDPFDRMLIAQARAEHLSLLTRDRAIIAHGEGGADVVTFDR